MKKHYTYVFAILFCALFLLGCKCKKGGVKENEDVADNVKATLFKFPSGTRWVFKSNTGDMDTVFLGPISVSYYEGDCVDHRDCCKIKYVQKIAQKLNYKTDADGLAKFRQFYFPDHYLIDTRGGSFAFSNRDSFDKSYKESLTVNAVLLNDVESRIDLGPNLGDEWVDAAYWSLSTGLVRYDYQKADGTFIVYEREDL